MCPEGEMWEQVVLRLASDLTMISAVFLVDSRGDIVISRLYRCVACACAMCCGGCGANRCHTGPPARRVVHRAAFAVVASCSDDVSLVAANAFRVQVR